MTIEEVRALTDLELSERVWKALGLVGETRTGLGPMALYKRGPDAESGWLGAPSACTDWTQFGWAEAQMRAMGYNHSSLFSEKGWMHWYSSEDMTGRPNYENPDHPQPELRARCEAMLMALMEEHRRAEVDLANVGMSDYAATLMALEVE